MEHDLFIASLDWRCIYYDVPACFLLCSGVFNNVYNHIFIDSKWEGKDNKYKRFMWGFTFIFPLSIVLSITIGLQVAIIEQQNLAVFIIIIYVFPIIIVIGLIYLFSGLVIVLSERDKRKYYEKVERQKEKDIK